MKNKQQGKTAADSGIARIFADSFKSNIIKMSMGTSCRQWFPVTGKPCCNILRMTFSKSKGAFGSLPEVSFFHEKQGYFHGRQYINNPY
jgi:hypothetical protein